MAQDEAVDESNVQKEMSIHVRVCMNRDLPWFSGNNQNQNMFKMPRLLGIGQKSSRICRLIVALNDKNRSPSWPENR